MSHSNIDKEEIEEEEMEEEEYEEELREKIKNLLIAVRAILQVVTLKLQMSYSIIVTLH